MIEVIDDFIEKDYQEKIKKVLLSCDEETNAFPWYYLDDITYEGESNSQKRPALYHLYIDINEGVSELVSDYHGLFTPLLQKVGMKLGMNRLEVCKGRSFLQFPSQYKGADTAHIDIPEVNHIVALYYVMDSDGDTIIYNEREESQTYTVKQRVTPKQGRMVIFDGRLYHTAEQPNKSIRCIVNYDILFNK